MLVLIRSILFQTYFYLSVAIAATLVVLVWPVPKWSFSVTRFWSLGMLSVGKWLCGLDYVIEGQENVPDHPCVIMVKHTSVFEAYAQVILSPRNCWVLKRELFWVPFFGIGLMALKPIAINRGAGSSAVKQVIRQGKERLAEGIWVTVFPEGTRVAPGTTKKYGVSGAALAKEAGVPIVPVAHNAGDLWPRRSLRKKPGLIRVCIGPPIDASELAPKDTNLVVQDWIESKMREISAGYKDENAGSSEPAPSVTIRQDD